MIIDASVWVSYFIPTDRFLHAQTVAWLDGLEPSQTLKAPMLLLPEVTGAVTRRTQNRTFALLIKLHLLAWPSLQLVPVDEGLLLLAADVAISLAMKGPDAIYVATAQMEHAPLVTWDEEQRIRAKSLVPTSSPARFLHGC